MKKFMNPILQVSKFSMENIVTASGGVDKVEAAVTSEQGGVTLDGKTLVSTEVIKVIL